MKRIKECFESFIYGIFCAVIFCIFSIIGQACENTKVYPELTEQQGDYIQLEFINEDGTKEYSSIEYAK
jgi:hypothetical protein